MNNQNDQDVRHQTLAAVTAYFDGHLAGPIMHPGLDDLTGLPDEATEADVGRAVLDLIEAGRIKPGPALQVIGGSVRTYEKNN